MKFSNRIIFNKFIINESVKLAIKILKLLKINEVLNKQKKIVL